MTNNRFFSKSAWINKLLSPFAFLNYAQFLGALNDNYFKLILTFFLIEKQGVEATNQIISLAGIIFVLPFLLLSSLGGLLAEIYPKRSIAVFTKVVDILVGVLIVVGFYTESSFLGYSCLFLTASQSAIFGPSKYGLIHEIVERDELAKANGYLVAITNLAIILGTTLASVLVEISNKQWLLISLFYLLMAILGLLAALALPKGVASRKEGSGHFASLLPQAHWKVLKECRKDPALFFAIIGSCFFFFAGGFAQLNVVPYCMQVLNLPDTKSGYLFLIFAIGNAIGSSFIGRKLSQPRLIVSALGGIGIAICFFLMGIGLSLSLTLLIIAFCGLVGGVYLIPLDFYIQVHSPQNNRGPVFGLINFLSFIGVLIASVFLYCLQIFGTSSAQFGFVIIAFSVLYMSLLLFRVDVEYCLHAIASHLLPFTKYPKVQIDPPTELSVWILPHFSLPLVTSLLASQANLHPVFIYPNQSLLTSLLKTLGLASSQYPHTFSFRARLVSLLQKKTTLIFFADQWYQFNLLKQLINLGVPESAIRNVEYTENHQVIFHPINLALAKAPLQSKLNH